MARGIIKHLKRMFAPKHWMLDKLKGRWAPKPSAGPHKLRECMPLIVMLRERLKYALTYREVKMIVMQRLIKVDGKVRSDMFYPSGFMDVVQIEKTKENFRLLYNTKGRFVLHKIVKEEASYKLCRVKKVQRGPKGIPYCITHDGRTIRYPDPEIKTNDSVRLDLATGKILDFVKFEPGNTVMISGGNNMGRVGTISHRERHPGSFEIVHIKDAVGHSFNTRLENVMVVGKGNKPWISLPKGNGIKLSINEDRNARMGAQGRTPVSHLPGPARPGLLAGEAEIMRPGHWALLFGLALAGFQVASPALAEARSWSGAPPVASSSARPRLRQLVDVLTGAADLRGRQQAAQLCVADERLTLRFAASANEFGPWRWQLLEQHPSASERRVLHSESESESSSMTWAEGGGRRRRSCKAGELAPSLQRVLQTELFPFTVGRIRRVLLDHLERIFDLGMVYHDFYAGALSEGGGPLQHRASLVKRLGEFAIGEEGDPEGYAYPQTGSTDSASTGISPTATLELVGQFFYHAHGREQCAPSSCTQLGSSAVPVLHLRRVVPLHMRKAFCNYYHFTTVGLARLTALLPRLLADPSIVVTIPHVNKKGQNPSFIRQSLQLLGIGDERVLDFPPCRLVFAEELLVAGAGPRATFGRGADGRVRSVMQDIADAWPAWRVRAAVLRALPHHFHSGFSTGTPQAAPNGVKTPLLLVDRHERRRIGNLAEVLEAFKGPQWKVSLIYCENMSFVEQVAAFASTRAVAAVHGACLSNSLYMGRGSLVVDAVPVQNFMGAGVVMPVECGVTWFWTLTSNVEGVRYRTLMLAAGDFDADNVTVPPATLRSVILSGLAAVKHEPLPQETRRDFNSTAALAGRASTPILTTTPVPVIVVAEGTPVASTVTATPATSLATSAASSPATGSQEEAHFECSSGVAPGRVASSRQSVMCSALSSSSSQLSASELSTFDASERAAQLAGSGPCAMHLARGDTAEALGCLQRSFEARRDPAAVARLVKEGGRGDFTTTLRKLWHDYELLKRLEGRKLLSPDLAGSSSFFRSLFVAARQGREHKPDKAFEVRLPAEDPRRQLFAQLHNTALQVPEFRQELESSGVLSSGPAGSQLRLQADEDLLLRGQAVLDNVLSASALRLLRQQLQESSVYYYVKHGGLYLLGLLEDGLASQLLADLAKALRFALPRSFGASRLCEARAWKALGELPSGPPGATKTTAITVTTAGSAVDLASLSPGLSAGGADVALLLWVVPEKALVSPNSAPLSLPAQNGTLNPVRYAVNRAVLWRDNCAAVAPIWHGAQFRQGFLKRGIHLVLRFQSSAAAESMDSDSDMQQLSRTTKVQR
ncbi:unnamed protein product [Polarella glacialis]|uniref:KOW domain-containing protein n=1 Tax=Polarella glacialis TaxID=89957 RepID=A0A813IIZ5_POLGL|nr:unnamed protein product [Polarella glacialis]